MVEVDQVSAAWGFELWGIRFFIFEQGLIIGAERVGNVDGTPDPVSN